MFWEKMTTGTDRSITRALSLLDNGWYGWRRVSASDNIRVIVRIELSQRIIWIVEAAIREA